MTLNEKQAKVLAILSKNMPTSEDFENHMQKQVEKKLAAIKRGNWIVEVKQAGDALEVSAVIEGSHGHKSWGWHDEKTKHIVLSVSGNLGKQARLPNHIFDMVVVEAQRVCDEKNK